jgi:uncharacterized protein YceK
MIIVIMVMRMIVVVMMAGVVVEGCAHVIPLKHLPQISQMNTD